MSALALVIPFVQAMAETDAQPIRWTGPAEDGLPPRKGPRRLRLVRCSAGSGGSGGSAGSAGGLSETVRHPHRARLAVAPSVAEPRLEPAPEMAFYRKYTEAMLRRYQVLSMEAGRVPSLLGREMFRGHVTSYKVRSFDDVVIFCHDVGRCLEQLDAGQRVLVRRIAIEEHTQAETAALTGLSLRTVVRRYAEALDVLSAVFLERKLLEPLV